MPSSNTAPQTSQEVTVKNLCQHAAREGHCEEAGCGYELMSSTPFPTQRVPNTSQSRIVHVSGNLSLYLAAPDDPKPTVSDGLVPEGFTLLDDVLDFHIAGVLWEAYLLERNPDRCLVT